MVDFEATLRSSLAGYAIESEIGTGAMAVVFLANDLKHDRNVAIKVLRPELTSAIGADRFNREIEVVAGLTHPHILPLHDSGDVDGLLYYVMPYIAGGSLRDRLARDGRLPIPDATRITREIADALGFAHRRGVIHRDVKPANILLAEDHALLADFGIAHLAETEGGTLTGTGLTLGTPTYFSPEQATGEHDIDGRSDIYSLGCVLYETLTGEPPFTGPSVQALIAHHIVDEPPRAKQLRPDVSDGIEAVVQTALRKEPDRRFQTAGEMAGSLDLVSGGFEVMAARALRKLLGPRYRWLHGWRLAALVASAIAVLAVGAFLARYLRLGPAIARPYPVYAVFPYEGRELSPEELELATRAARGLYVHLQGWESITVVNGMAIEGPTTRLVQAGFSLPTQSVLAGLEYADRVDATHVIWIEPHLSGDSVTLLGRIHTLPDERPTQTLTQKGRRDQISLLTAGLALEVLQINGEPAELGDLRSRSSHPGAHQEHSQGWSALLDWRLAEAEEFFRSAVALDSAFALAHYHLALTMYWRTVRDPERILDGETIEFHLGQADRFGDTERLRAGERRELNALRSFWSGNYEAARSQYAAILQRDPTRVDAWVMMGALEHEDPWLVEDREGNPLGPRGDLNLALAAFDSAVALDGRVQLAWGSMFEIARQVALAAYENRCYGFLPPGGPLIPPYVFPEAAELRIYCPYQGEGEIRWVADSLSDSQKQRAMAGIRQVRTGFARRLESWERVQRDQPRPHEELADWMLWERSARGCDAESLWADSLLHAGRLHQERALELRGDTTPEDRLRLAILLLAAGETSRAEDMADRAIDELGDWVSRQEPPPPKLAANIYLALGRGHPAVEILEGVSNLSTWAAPDSTAGEGYIPGGPVWGTLWAIAVLGMTGDDDPGLGERFETVRRTWSDMGYTERQQALLRAHTTALVSPGLLRLPEQQAGWFADWDLHDRSMSSSWEGLRILDEDPEEARRHLERAIDEVEARPETARSAFDFYMAIQLAERLGDEATVAELYARAASCPLGMDNIDLGWGMTRHLAEARLDGL